MRAKFPLIASIIVLLFVLPVKATEPQISFVVKNRWVKFTLTHDETPVTNGMVRVFDGFGNTFAEGETGANGQGEFPLPSGHQFKVEIKIGERTADLIPVTSIGGNRVVPNRVLLSFGLAPCCRIVSRGVVEKQTATVLSPHEPSDKKEIGSNLWIPAIGALILLLAGTCLVLLAFRPSTSTENTLAKELS
jgi:hypothetical protein